MDESEFVCLFRFSWVVANKFLFPVSNASILNLNSSTAIDNCEYIIYICKRAKSKKPYSYSWTYIPCFISCVVSEQCSWLQCSVFTKDPLHGLPPFLSVTAILREVILTPPPQVALHRVQGSQLPHWQSTSLSRLNIFWLNENLESLYFGYINELKIGIKSRLSNLIYLLSIYSPNFEINNVAPSLILSKMTMFYSENDHNS